MKSKTILLLILCCLLLSACGQEAPQPEGENPAQTEESPAPSREYSINEPYEYPIRPGMPEWAELDGLPQMGTACRIPVDILLNMSTEALVETVMDYPLLWNILAYDSPAAGVESVESYFNGLPALYGRADGLSAFRENYEALSALIDSGELAEEEATVARLNLRTAGFILERMEELDARDACKKVRQCVEECLTDREREIIVQRYGLDARPPRTQREIAGQCGISRSYVSRRH